MERKPDVENIMASNLKSILIFETALTGHRGHYVRVIDSICDEQKWSAVFCLSPVNGKLFLRSEIDEIIGSHPSQGIFNGFYRVKFFLEALFKHRPQTVVIPTADGLSFYLWLLSPFFLAMNIHVVCVQHRFQHGYAKTPKHRLIQYYTNFAVLAAANCRFYSVDEVPVEYLKDNNPLRINVEFLPDPLPGVGYPDKASARMESGLDPEEIIVGCVGVNDARKNIPEILNLLPTLPKNVKILLAGEFTPELRPLTLDYLKKYPDQLILHDRFLSEKEMFAYLSSLDGIILLQRGHVGISSFGLHALRLGLPILAADTPWFKLMQGRFPGLVSINEGPATSLHDLTTWIGHLASQGIPRTPRVIPESEAAFRDKLIGAVKTVS